MQIGKSLKEKAPEVPSTYPLPDEDQIQGMITQIYNRLDLPEMDLLKNAAVKEGYIEAIDILADDRRDYKGIEKLKTVQGRAIAVLAVDYLLGECKPEVLLDFPLKK